MRDIKVLITAAGSPASPGLISCLKNNGERIIKVVGVDMQADPTIKQMVDAFYQVPACSEPDYVDKLLEICKIEKVDVLIPGVSQELLELLKRRKEFEKNNTLVSVSEGEGLHIANDKILLYEYMSENGFIVPNSNPSASTSIS